MRGRITTAGGTVALLALITLAPGIRAETAGTEEPRLGISVNRVFNDNWFDQPFVDRHLSEVREAGIRLARTDAFWMAVEETPPKDGVHSYNWAFTDFAATNLTRHGLQWLPILDYSALWAGSAGEHSPPKDLDDYAAYARAFAERYGRDGEFWDLHPELAYAPVTTYEIWNEPNGAWFWHPEPDAELYAEMYARARTAIKAADPGAVVMIGGLVPGNEYVRALFGALDESDTEADAIGFHPYAPTPGDIYWEVRSFRSTLDAVGQAGLPIYITEIGWPTSGGYLNTRPDSERARYLPEVADTLVRSDCNIRQVIPYTWTTPEQDPNNSEDWYGIYHWQGGHTDTSSAYAELLQPNADPPDAGRAAALCGEPAPDPPRPSLAEAPPPEPPTPDPLPGLATARDTLPPEVSVRMGRHRLRRLLRRGARAAVSCSEACRVTAVLMLPAPEARRLGLRPLPADNSIVAWAGLSVPAQGSGWITLRPTPWALPVLARARRVRLRLTVVASDDAGNSRTATTSLAARRR